MLIIFYSLRRRSSFFLLSFFFFNDTATTEIYTLSLHDALPIFGGGPHDRRVAITLSWPTSGRSEEHTSELQSRFDLVCRLLLEKKKKCIVLRARWKYKMKNQNYNTFTNKT